MSQPKFVYQEFYCRVSGQGCGGYIVVPVNMALNGVIEVICPKCGHKHQRFLVDGKIQENGRDSGKPNQELCPTLAAWSPKPRIDQAKKYDGDAIVFDPSANSILKESMMDRFGKALLGKG